VKKSEQLLENRKEVEKLFGSWFCFVESLYYLVSQYNNGKEGELMDVY